MPGNALSSSAFAELMSSSSTAYTLTDTMASKPTMLSTNQQNDAQDRNCHHALNKPHQGLLGWMIYGHLKPIYKTCQASFGILPNSGRTAIKHALVRPSTRAIALGH